MEIDLRIQLVPEAQPIRGAVISDGGARIEFTGWLGLAAVIGKLVDQEPRASDEG